MKAPLIGIDVDGCLAPSIDGWKTYLEYFNGFGKVVHRTDGMLEYDLSNMYPTVRNPYEYWRTLDYDQFNPMESSVQALKQLSEHFGIVFISRIKGNHTKSKYYWLKEHYPFMTEYVATHGKWVMGGSIVAMIDDRLDVLVQFDYDQRILFKTNYTQSVECSVPYQFSEWNEQVVERLCGMYL